MNEHVSPETIIDYLHEELEPGEDARVHAHISQCAQCAAAFNAQTRLTERLRALARSEERDLPARVLYGVRRQAQAARPAWWMQLRAPFRPAMGLPAAAVLVLAAALGLSWIVPHGTQTPSIAANYYLDDHAALATSSLPFEQTTAVPTSLSQQGSAQDSKNSGQASTVPPNSIASE